MANTTQPTQPAQTKAYVQKGFSVQNKNNAGSIRLADLSDNTSEIEVDIAKAKPAERIPVGIIVMYTGSFNNVPMDWRFCDGSNGTPDLRGRFILGSAPGNNPVGGSKEAVLPKHSHNIVKTNAQAAHTHTVDYVNTKGSAVGNHTHEVSKASDERIHLATIKYKGKYFNWSSRPRQTTGNTGVHSHTVTIPSHNTNTYAAHTHTAVVSTSTGQKSEGNLPPYYTLAYIMKVK